jgi:activator of HSP90 ATPase
MPATIEQSVRFPATARELFDLYVSPKHHAAFTGGAVKISRKAGSRFSAFGGMLTGVTLAAEPGKLVVQRWRSGGWKETDPDSVLVLSFVQDGSRGRIDLVHANVPDHDRDGVTKGWEKYYWKPLRAYLKRRGGGTTERPGRRGGMRAAGK